MAEKAAQPVIPSKGPVISLLSDDDDDGADSKTWQRRVRPKISESPTAPVRQLAMTPARRTAPGTTRNIPTPTFESPSDDEETVSKKVGESVETEPDDDDVAPAPVPEGHDSTETDSDADVSVPTPVSDSHDSAVAVASSSSSSEDDDAATDRKKSNTKHKHKFVIYALSKKEREATELKLPSCAECSADVDLGFRYYRCRDTKCKLIACREHAGKHVPAVIMPDEDLTIMRNSIHKTAVNIIADLKQHPDFTDYTIITEAGHFHKQPGGAEYRGPLQMASAPGKVATRSQLESRLEGITLQKAMLDVTMSKRDFDFQFTNTRFLKSRCNGDSMDPKKQKAWGNAIKEADASGPALYRFTAKEHGPLWAALEQEEDRIRYCLKKHAYALDVSASAVVASSSSSASASFDDDDEEYKDGDEDEDEDENDHGDDDAEVILEKDGDGVNSDDVSDLKSDVLVRVQGDGDEPGEDDIQRLVEGEGLSTVFQDTLAELCDTYKGNLSDDDDSDEDDYHKSVKCATDYGDRKALIQSIVKSEDDLNLPSARLRKAASSSASSSSPPKRRRIKPVTETLAVETPVVPVTAEADAATAAPVETVTVQAFDTDLEPIDG